MKTNSVLSAPDGLALDPEDFVMKFHFVYDGPLPSSGANGGKSRVREKHHIRRALHAQLIGVWAKHPGFGAWVDGKSGADAATGTSIMVGDYEFVSIVTGGLGLTCELEVLLLSRTGS